VFGVRVSISGDYAVVGASVAGSAYIFKREGVNWTEQAILNAGDGAAVDRFGGAVSISGDYAIVGASQHDDNGSNSGSAYIFMRDSVNWIQVQKLLASDGAADDEFGSSVSISGDDEIAIVGTPLHDDNFENSGSAYVYSGFVTGIDEEISDVPTTFSLEQNYPNPFNPTTTIKYDLPKDSKVVLSIYNLLGQEIRTLVNGTETAGRKAVVWNGKNDAGKTVGSGVYVYRLEAGATVKSRKMLFLK